MRRSLPLFLVLALAACSVQPSTTTPGTTPAPAAPAAQVDARDEWLRPDVVLGMMNNDVSGMTIADLFAGDGYFTFRLVRAGARVIAIENDPANVAKLEARKKELGLTDAQLVIRNVPVGDTGLGTEEADVALLVHGYAQIADKPAYFKRLREGMRFPRALMLIDWQYAETPMGPTIAERTPTEVLMEQLGRYGWAEVGAHSDKLPYQVVFFATDPMDEI